MFDLFVDLDGDDQVRLTARTGTEIHSAVVKELDPEVRDIRKRTRRDMRSAKSGSVYSVNGRRRRASAEGETVGVNTGNLSEGLKIQRRGDRVLLRSTSPHTHLVTQKLNRVIFEHQVIGREKEIANNVLNRSLQRLNK